MRGAAALLLLTLASVARVSAQVPKLPPIDTDRPDLTDGTATVARGRVQLESGYTRVTTRQGATSYTAPELLARIGVLAAAELRIAATYSSADQGAPLPSVAGWDDLQLGTKIRLTPQRGNRPSFSMEAFTSLPTGADGVTAGRALPGAALLAQWDSDGAWAVGAEIQASRDPEEGVSWTPSVSIQYRPWEPVQFYGEFYSQQSTGAISPVESYFNGGILILLSNNVQVDAKIGVGLNHAAARNYFGFGLALRR